METQCNQTQYLIQWNKICAHTPTESENDQVSLSNSLASPYPPDPGEHALKWSATATSVQDSPVKWFKIMCTSSKLRMPDTSILTDVYGAYSPIDFMNHKWTINLHDGYPSKCSATSGVHSTPYSNSLPPQVYHVSLWC